MNTIEHIKVKNYSAGETVFKEGEKSDDFYIILTGKAEVIKNNSHNKEVVLAILSPGEVFGELGIILGLSRQATVRAKTNLELEIIDPRLFSSYFDFDKETGEKMRAMIQTMAQRIRDNGARLADFLTERDSESYETSDSERGSIKLVADSSIALKAMNGMKSIEITKFPFRVGRYSKRSSDRLFHRNDLYLRDDKPYVISRSHFSILHLNKKYYFQDASSQNGSFVNGENVHGSTRKIRSVTVKREKKAELKKGENEIYLADEKYNIRFKIIV